MSAVAPARGPQRKEASDTPRVTALAPPFGPGSGAQLAIAQRVRYFQRTQSRDLGEQRDQTNDSGTVFFRFTCSFRDNGWSCSRTCQRSCSAHSGRSTAPGRQQTRTHVTEDMVQDPADICRTDSRYQTRWWVVVDSRRSNRSTSISSVPKPPDRVGSLRCT